MTTQRKASMDGAGNRPAPKSKSDEARALERERHWRSVVAGFRAVISEMRRVTWPSREEWLSATAVVVGLVVVVALWTQLISFLLHVIGFAQ